MTINVADSAPVVKRAFYSDDAVYAKEIETIFSRSWLVVGLESEIPAPGDYVTRQLAADPVIVARGEDGQLRVMHNSCTHRGNQLCKASFGNSANFRCGYHGWTYGNDGAVRGIPGRRTLYGPDLDITALGLRTARVATRHGLIFATWNHDGPSLEEYLGEFRWYLDALLDLFPGGMEVYGGPHRVVIRGNWKIHSENFCGDGYHLRIAHRTMFELGVMGKQDGALKGYCISSPEGHALRAQYVDDDEASDILFGYPEYLIAGASAHADRDTRAFRTGSSVIHGTLFPNAPFITTAPVQYGTDATGQTAFTQIRALTPLGPHAHEVMYWAVVPVDAPEEWKKKSYLYSIRQHGAASFFEADDLENFRRIDSSLGGQSASDERPFDYQLGVGAPTGGPPPFSGPCKIVSQDFSETNQRNFYRRYMQLMNADNG